MENKIVFLINDWLHNHFVEVRMKTYTEEDKEYVLGEFDSFQDYVDKEVRNEIQSIRKNNCECFAMSKIAYDNLQKNAVITEN